MDNFFQSNNPFLISFSLLVDSLILGLLWFVCSIPLITVGASSSAFYYAYHKCIRQKRGYAWKEFFHGFKLNFKQSTISWLILLVLSAILVLDSFILNSINSTIPFLSIFQAVILVMLMCLIMFALFLFAYIARFEDTTIHMFKSSFLILFANLPWGILLFVIFSIAFFFSRRLLLLIPIILVFMPTAYMFFANKILEHIFRKYMKPEDVALQKEYEQEDFPIGN